ncbi:hypothetical protein MP638_003591 [Amoeboaphelidium occidentale]|nr:hypothetical protein MP638_003591 [Amoeboaphelidium occidentale]
MADLTLDKLTLDSTSDDDKSSSDAATWPEDVQRFFALLSTEPMVLACKDALATLDKHFVSIPHRNFMVKIIENGLKMSPISSQEITQLEIARCYLSKPGYIKKPSRETIKQALKDIMDKGCGKQLCKNIEWTSKECFYAFTCLGVSDLIANVFRKIHVHSWSVSSAPKGYILASGDFGQEEFVTNFRKSWSCKDFSANLVLPLIAFERSPMPLLIPDCSQGSGFCFDGGSLYSGNAFSDYNSNPN